MACQVCIEAGPSNQGERNLMTWDVESQAKLALAKSPIQALHDLHVECDGQKLLISGSVNSFYHKQLAQEIVRLIARDLRVVNAIDVQYVDDVD